MLVGLAPQMINIILAEIQLFLSAKLLKLHQKGVVLPLGFKSKHQEQGEWGGG